jgi:hypothetical protein
MSSLLPWPNEYMLAREWCGVGRLLSRCLDLHRRGLLPSTLLLLGEQGFGREALAVELAAGLVCPEDGGPACVCSACSRARRGIHPDVEILAVVEGNQEIKIKQAKDFVLRLSQVPYEGRRRVIVVASAHTPPLNLHAASALLKALEEPPPHVTILLLAANSARVLPTVVSRSVTVRIPPPSDAELPRFLAALHGADEAAIVPLIAALGGDLHLLSHPSGLATKDLVPELGARLVSALSGDGLGLTTAAALIRQTPAGHEVAVRALLLACHDTPPGLEEAVLDAAAGLLTAAHRSEVLRIDGEATALAALAPLTLASMAR